MNVIAYRNNGCVYLDEFKNDNDKINQVLESSSRIEELNQAYDDMWELASVRNYSDVHWNQHMEIMIAILEEAGCTIIWDT